MPTYNSSEKGTPCERCGAQTTKEISVSEICSTCGTYVEDCECPPLERQGQLGVQ